MHVFVCDNKTKILRGKSSVWDKIVILLDDASLSTVTGRVASQATSKICRYIIVMVIQIHESRESVIATIFILVEVWSLVDAVKHHHDPYDPKMRRDPNKSSTLLHAIKRDNEEEKDDKQLCPSFSGDKYFALIASLQKGFPEPNSTPKKMPKIHINCIEICKHNKHSTAI